MTRQKSNTSSKPNSFEAELRSFNRLPFSHMARLVLSLNGTTNTLRAATGQDFSMDKLNLISDRILTLIRAFWVREYGEQLESKFGCSAYEVVQRTLNRGPLKGSVLNLEKYNAMLDIYYQKRGWNQNGVPTKETLEKLGLAEVASQLTFS